MNSDTSINHPFESEKVIIVRAITPLVAKDTTTALERGNSTTNEKVSEIRLTLQTETTEQYPDQNLGSATEAILEQFTYQSKRNFGLRSVQSRNNCFKFDRYSSINESK